MSSILVGTSGYSYSDWVGPVYPPGTPPAAFLEYYARRFPFTELNFTYYRRPSAESLGSIAARTPSSFLFTVKAHRSLTHDRSDNWKHDADQFARALDALAAHPEQNRLAGVLLQFPFSFHYDRENRRYLASLTDALRPLRLFVEYRNAEWDQASVLREMERRELGLVVPDLPRLKGLPRIRPRLTSPWGYVRFHGRNTDQWWHGTNVTRYDYLYSESELQEWLEPVREMADQGEAVFVAFNNHFAGQAVHNAEQFISVIHRGGGQASSGVHRRSVRD